MNCEASRRKRNSYENVSSSRRERDHAHSSSHRLWLERSALERASPHLSSPQNNKLRDYRDDAAKISLNKSMPVRIHRDPTESCQKQQDFCVQNPQHLCLSSFLHPSQLDHNQDSTAIETNKAQKQPYDQPVAGPLKPLGSSYVSYESFATIKNDLNPLQMTKSTSKHVRRLMKHKGKCNNLDCIHSMFSSQRHGHRLRSQFKRKNKRCYYPDYVGLSSFSCLSPSFRGVNNLCYQEQLTNPRRHQFLMQIVACALKKVLKRHHRRVLNGKFSGLQVLSRALEQVPIEWLMQMLSATPENDLAPNANNRNSLYSGIDWSIKNNFINNNNNNNNNHNTSSNPNLSSRDWMKARDNTTSRNWSILSKVHYSIPLQIVALPPASLADSSISGIERLLTEFARTPTSIDIKHTCVSKDQLAKKTNAVLESKNESTDFEKQVVPTKISSAFPDRKLFRENKDRHDLQPVESYWSTYLLVSHASLLLSNSLATNNNHYHYLNCLTLVQWHEAFRFQKYLWFMDPLTYKARSIEFYFLQLASESQTSCEMILVALALLDRLYQRGAPICAFTIHSFVLLCLIAAHKLYQEDREIHLSEWARMAKIPMSRLAVMEGEFYRLLDYDVFVTHADYINVFNQIKEPKLHRPCRCYHTPEFTEHSSLPWFCALPGLPI